MWHYICTKHLSTGSHNSVSVMWYTNIDHKVKRTNKLSSAILPGSTR